MKLCTRNYISLILTLLVIQNCTIRSMQTDFLIQNYSNIIEKYQNLTPEKWGEKVFGVKTRLDTADKVLALTLDACGSATDGCDYRYVNFLKQENIPATIFVSNQWITRHPEDFKELMKCDLFDIENHGLCHLPCSVNGKSIYKVQGTKNPSEVVIEIEKNAKIVQKFTGKKPKYYRSGTAYYDEIAVKIANDLGYDVIGFDILGDAGTTWGKETVKQALLKSRPGSIIILHMNHPEKDCAIGAIDAIKKLKENGFVFVKLSQYLLK